MKLFDCLFEIPTEVFPCTSPPFAEGRIVSARSAVQRQPVNDPPVAIDDSAEADQDVAETIDVLANDTDVDSVTLTVTDATNGANGTVTINPDHTVNYTPNAGFFGTDSFDYTVSDGNGGTDTGTVTIDVAQASTETAMYVYDIRFDNKLDGKFRRAVFEIHSEGAPLAGVQVTATFADETFTGYSDENGVFSTNWIRNLPSGDYYANVIDLLMTDYDWDRTMDVEDDSDEVDGPDDLLSFGP